MKDRTVVRSTFTHQVYQRSSAGPLLLSRSSRTLDAGHRLVFGKAKPTTSTGHLEISSITHTTRPVIEETGHSLTILSSTLSQETARLQLRPAISRYQHLHPAATSHCRDDIYLPPFPANVASQVSTRRWHAKAGPATEAGLECGPE